MNRPNTTAKAAILRALLEIGKPAGAARLQERLLAAGCRLEQRTVRFYLLELDREGLTRRVSRRAGRELTEQGRHELACANIIEKIRFIASRIDSLVYRMTYDSRIGTGTIVANLAFIPRDGLVRALEIMRPVFQRRLGMGTRLAIVEGGESLGVTTVPRDQMALGTVCSITANGILLKQGIPVVSRFGGLMDIQDRRPIRFTALIEYNGTTLDPLEAFIRAGMTQVRECVRTNCGILGVGFREIPAAAVTAVRRIKEEMDRQGLDGILAIGTPNQPLFDIPVGEGRAGLIVTGGLNPIAALCEAGVPVTFQSLAEVEDIARFSDFNARSQQFRG
jgi:hypothetical protein